MKYWHMYKQQSHCKHCIIFCRKKAKSLFLPILLQDVLYPLITSFEVNGRLFIVQTQKAGKQGQSHKIAGPTKVTFLID